MEKLRSATGIRLTAEDRERLEALARATRWSKSEVLRQLIAAATLENAPSLTVGELKAQEERK
jgi:predicted DNA-binding protein